MKKTKKQPENYFAIPDSMVKFVWLNFIGGIARGIGAFFGSVIFIAILIWLLSKTNFGESIIDALRIISQIK